MGYAEAGRKRIIKSCPNDEMWAEKISVGLPKAFESLAA